MIDGPRFEIAEIRIFMLLAEELHFGRTAERAGLSQARVSQLVRRLETRLGKPVISRTNHTSSLTPFGRLFLDQIAGPYQALHDVFSSARHAEPLPLRLGMVAHSSSVGPCLFHVLGNHLAAQPGRSLRLVEVSLQDPLGPLRRDEVDALCVRQPIRQPDLVVGPTLTIEERILLVSRDDELATRSGISLEELSSRRLVDAPGLPPELAEALLPSRTPSGRAIPRGPVVHSMSEVMLAVATGAAVHPTAASTLQFRAHPDVVGVPLVDAPQVQSSLVTRKARMTPGTRELLAIAESVSVTGRREGAARTISSPDRASSN